MPKSRGEGVGSRCAIPLDLFFIADLCGRRRSNHGFLLGLDSLLEVSGCEIGFGKGVENEVARVRLDSLQGKLESLLRFANVRVRAVHLTPSHAVQSPPLALLAAPSH